MKTTLLLSTAAIIAIAAASPSLAKDRGGPMHGEMAPSFETLDADSDGNITIAELRALADTRFTERDTNKDGVLSAEELTAGELERATKRAERMIEWRDQDGDGALSQSELGGNMGERMFARADADDDGMISEEEFDNAKSRGHRGKRGEGKRRGGHRNDG